MDNTQAAQSIPELESAWGYPPLLLVCDRCGWGFLAPGDLPAQRCPHCFNASLSSMGDPRQAVEQGLTYTNPPELVAPFTLVSEKLASSLDRFSQGIPFPPDDLKAASLRARMQRIFLPVWLVDVGVRAAWQAEAGFNYEVVSHQEKYSQVQGGWQSQEVTETRIRWEPRQGRLDRAYPNNPVPALEGEPELKEVLGNYRLDGAQPYAPQAAWEAFVRLPDRNPEDAWRELPPSLQAAAAEDCRRAAGADHLRDFRWQPDFHQPNWTLLLLPLYATYYLDDEQRPQAVYLDGQSGLASGERRASPKRARRTALIILAVAAAVFLLSLLLALAGFLVPPLLVVGGLGLAIALLVGLAAIIPPAIAWQFNRSQTLAAH